MMEQRRRSAVVRWVPVAGGLLLVLCFVMWQLGNPVWTHWAALAVAIILFGLASQLFAWEKENMRDLMAARSRSDVMELELRRQREVVDSFADGLNVALFLTDARGIVLYCNRAALRMFGFESAVGRSILAVTLSSELERLVLGAAEDGLAKEAELTFSYPESRIGVARTWPEQPDLRRVFLSVYDVSDLRKLERVRQDFVANVSHELRTPMTGIRAMAETLLEPDENDDVLKKKYLQRMIREVDRLTLIADDLLVLSRSESQKVNQDSFDLVELCTDVVSQHQEKAAAKGLVIETHLPDTLVITADPDQISQVLVNLIDNAIKYTNQGEIAVSVQRQQSEAVIEVRDTGLGIATEHQSRIFERFYRVDKARSRESGGTGLGLSIVRHIVESHGGTISLESALNHGSTFVVRLPILPQSTDKDPR